MASWPTCANRWGSCAKPSSSFSSHRRCPASVRAEDCKATCRIAPGEACRQLEQAAWAVAGTAGQTPGFTQAFTLFNTRTPQIYADIDRTKAEQLGVPISRVFDTLSVYMGSAFVNDFNILGRTYRVTAQADNPFRLTLRDVANLKTRNVTGEMVPIGSVATFSDTTGPYRVPRYNLYPAAEVQTVAGARLLVGSGARSSREDRRRETALRLRLRMDGNCAAGKARRQHGDAGFRLGRRVRLSASGRTV